MRLKIRARAESVALVDKSAKCHQLFSRKLPGAQIIALENEAGLQSTDPEIGRGCARCGFLIFGGTRRTPACRQITAIDRQRANMVYTNCAMRMLKTFQS